MIEGTLWGRLIGVFVLLIAMAAVLIMNDSGKSEALIQKCPKCGKRALRKLAEQDKRLGAGNWLCAHCGNDEDGFGNKL